MKGLLISVIIPAYNAERYLDKCILSLQHQTYKNLELIIVNDGSTDHTGDVAQKYVNRDDRIRNHYKDNGGLSSARNAGIKMASGDYIFFLDSDDWLDEDYFKKCVDEIEKNPVDILFTSYIREYKDKAMPTLLFDRTKVIFRDQNDIQKNLLLRLFGPTENEKKSPTSIDNLNTAWGKFYRKSLIYDLQFADRNTVGTAEDLWFNIHAFYKATSALYYGETFLHYNKANPGSLVSTYHPEINGIMHNLFIMMQKFIEKHNLGGKYNRALENRIVLETFSQVLSLEYSNLNYIQKRKKCREIMNDELFRKSIKNFDYKNMDHKWKIFYKFEDKGMTDLVLAMVSSAIKLKDKIKR